MPDLIPVGWITPIFHATRMHKNKIMDTPTRIARAYAMRFDLAGALVPPRSIKNKAVAKLPRIAKKASATKYDMMGFIQ
jgi:hypothetical protein